MVSQPNFSKPQYTSKNIFAQAGYTGQCTWYANGRMQELGYSKEALDTMPGNACDWDNTAGKGCRVSSEPKVHSIANWEAGVGDASPIAGHVAVVEQINGNSILISEANWANKYWNTRTINRNTRYWPSHFILVPGGRSGGGYELDYKDPKDTHCDTDAYTVDRGTAQIKDGSGKVIGKVELRYSPSCATNWCRVTSLIGAASLAGSVKRQSDGVTCKYKLDNTTLIYTDMVYAKDLKAQACGSVNGHSACTDWI